MPISFYISRLNIMMVGAAVSTSLGSFAIGADHIEMPLFLQIIMCVVLIPIVYGQYSPVFTFLLIYAEISACIKAWAIGLREGLCKPSSASVEEFLIDGSQFIIALKKIRNLFSKHLFYMTTLFLFGVITTSYRFIAFFICIGCYNNHYAFSFFVVGYFGFMVILSLIIVFFAQISHEVNKCVKELLDEVILIDIKHCKNEDVIIPITDTRLQKMSPITAKGHIVYQLKTFKGFHAGEYFDFSKPTLVSILSSFITYMIILLQFRVGEQPA